MLFAQIEVLVSMIQDPSFVVIFQIKSEKTDKREWKSHFPLFVRMAN